MTKSKIKKTRNSSGQLFLRKIIKIHKTKNRQILFHPPPPPKNTGINSGLPHFLARKRNYIFLDFLKILRL